MTAIETLRSTSKNTLRDVLTRLEKEGPALGHFNVADQVLLKAVVAAGTETKLPVLVGASEGERDFFGPRQLAALVKSARGVGSATLSQRGPYAFTSEGPGSRECGSGTEDEHFRKAIAAGINIIRNGMAA